MKAKRIIAGCAISLAASIALIAIGLMILGKGMGWLYEHRWAKSPGPPRVVQGDALLSRQPFLADNRLWNGITDIRLGQLDGKPGMDVGIAGPLGAVIMTTDGADSSYVAFSGDRNFVEIVDVGQDGVCEFMDRGGHGCKPTLMDHAGKTIWTFHLPYARDTASGDVDGDGKLEFAVGYDFGTRLALLDETGGELWRQDAAHAHSLAMVDANQDGKLEILSTGERFVILRDNTGRVLKRSRAPQYIFASSTCAWPDGRHRKKCLLITDRNALRLLDYDGRVVASFDAPQCSDMWDAYGTLVKLKRNQPEFFAVIAGPWPGDGAALYVYDATKALVYQEVLSSGLAIAAIPADWPGEDQLLVGGDGRVWSYTAN